MIGACRKANVKLMIAYRLHFETINLAAIELARRGRLGELKFFNSSFSMTVRRGDIRTKRAYGGGTLYDIGVLLHQCGSKSLSLGAYSGIGGVDQQWCRQPR
jgi:glucose-fructose oxidoreductase